jgi:excisionase family DNA binding protein
VPHLMTIEEVAAYLWLSKGTVYRMAQSGCIPASKVGTQWRFQQGDVNDWLDENQNVRKEHFPE